MGDEGGIKAKCQFVNCDLVPEDNCSVCGKNTCRKHGTPVGDRFVCKKCADKVS